MIIHLKDVGRNDVSRLKDARERCFDPSGKVNKWKAYDYAMKLNLTFDLDFLNNYFSFFSEECFNLTEDNKEQAKQYIKDYRDCGFLSIGEHDPKEKKSHDGKRFD